MPILITNHVVNLKAWNQSTSSLSVSIVSCFDFVLLLMSRQLPGATRLDNGYWGLVLLDVGAGATE